MALKKGQDKAELMPSSCRYQGFLFHISAEGTQLVPLSLREDLHIQKDWKKKKKKDKTTICMTEVSASLIHLNFSSN